MLIPPWQWNGRQKWWTKPCKYSQHVPSSSLHNKPISRFGTPQTWITFALLFVRVWLNLHVACNILFVMYNLYDWIVACMGVWLYVATNQFSWCINWYSNSVQIPTEIYTWPICKHYAWAYYTNLWKYSYVSRDMYTTYTSTSFIKTKL